MEHPPLSRQLEGHPGGVIGNPETAATNEIRAGIAPSSQGGCSKCGCAAGSPDRGGASTYPFVYAIGRIQPRFPTLAVEKEFAQATGRAATAGLTDRQAVHAVLTMPENRYLARQLCWVLTIEDMETYILQPRDSADSHLLIEALRPSPRRTDVDVAIGIRGPVAPPELCNGLMVPIVAFDQIYSFDADSLIKHIPPPKELSEKQKEQFRLTADELLTRFMQMGENTGASNQHRALNYLVVRYDAIYARTAEMHQRNFSLTAVEARPSALSGVRSIVEVIFSYTHRESDFIEKYFVRVDVTEEFPFLATKLSPYFDR